MSLKPSRLSGKLHSLLHDVSFSRVKVLILNTLSGSVVSNAQLDRSSFCRLLKPQIPFGKPDSACIMTLLMLLLLLLLLLLPGAS